MSALSRIDAAVLGWHQDLVDALQRRPLWFARWCFAGLIVSELAYHALLASNLFAKALSVLLLLGLSLDCRSEATLSGTSSRQPGPRLFCLALLLLITVLASLAPAPARACQLLSVALLSAFFYFAACRPPRPRPPRMVAAGGAA